MVLATTNCPWDLDTAVLRRFEKRIYIPLPNVEARIAHFKMCLHQLNHHQDNGDFSDDNSDIAQHLAQLTEGFSSADIVILCREAAMAPMRRLLQKNSIADIQKMRDSGTLGFTKVSCNCNLSCA